MALTVGLLGIAQRLFDPGEARYVPYLFGDRRIELLSVPITYDRLFVVVVAAAVAFGLRFLLFGTGLGAQMRAVVDDGELAQLHGVRSRVVARLSWMIGFVLAALGGVLFAGGQNLSAIVLTLLVLNAYGAAMVGRLTSLPLTCVGALALGLIQELSNVSLALAGHRDVRPGAARPAGHLPRRRGAARALVPAVGRSGRRARRAEGARRCASSLITGLLLVGGVALFANVGSADLQSHVVRGLVTATIALSLVALTGLSGQVSLAQYLFVGIGAFVTGKAFGGESVLGMLAGGVVAAVLAGLVALPAVRLRGLHLALCTFGMALIGREVVLGDPQVFGLSGLTIGRPEVARHLLRIRWRVRGVVRPRVRGARGASSGWCGGAGSAGSSPRCATASWPPPRSGCRSGRRS